MSLVYEDIRVGEDVGEAEISMEEVIVAEEVGEAVEPPKAPLHERSSATARRRNLEILIML